MDALLNLPLSEGALIVILAFFCEYIDSAIGMGYGTIMSPVLLMMGFEPLTVVPSILLSELVTGFLAGFTHHSMGNIYLMPRTMNISRILLGLRRMGIFRGFSYGIPLHLKIVLLLGVMSLSGTVLAVFLATSLPARMVKLYIGAMILAIGVVILATMRLNLAFSWRRIVVLGLISSFNKGISGGGYGPVVTGGQLLAGVDPRNTIGITSLSEALTCIGGVALYLVSSSVDWLLAPYLILGAVLSLPFATLTVKIARTRSIRFTVGVLTIVLGIYTLWQIF
ncbi:sulfite exporter TauE/SafE family protein [Candidatus Latescibacterota bacterium]